MLRPTKIETRPQYRIWLEYSDGVSGEIDLSYLVGRGIFEAWNDPAYFQKAHITAHRSIAWDEQIELCPDAMYMKLDR